MHLLVVTSECLANAPSIVRNGQLIPYERKFGDFASLADSLQVELMRDSILTDVINVPQRRMLLMHRRLHESLVSSRMLPERCIMGTSLVMRQDEVLSDEYVLLYPDVQYDVLNREKSLVKELVRPDGSRVIISVREWVVHEHLLPGFNSFYSYPNDWLVRDCFAEHVKCHNFTGITFARVAVSL